MRKKKLENLKEAPLGYWEESSYMMVVPEEATQELLDGILDRLLNMKEIKILEKQPLTEETPGKVRLIYEEEEYEIGFYPSGFSVPEFYLNQNYYFTEEEKKNLMNAKASLTIFMKFNQNAKKSYHLQLKLALAMVPNMLGIMDESAEKMLPTAWVKMTANSKILPGANTLYNVQAVSNDEGETWLHTHGLCRCGLTELEILKSDQKNYNNHYNLISTLASYLLDKKEEYQGSAYIGLLVNRQPVVATYVSWTQGLKEYQQLKLGNIEDRQNGHNSKTSIIFLYKNEKDEKNKTLTEVSEFNDLWGENPIFFISNEETERMKQLAIEKFDYVKKAFQNKENNIIIKIGLPIDNENNFEHIWFELIELNEDQFKAKLLQEPYDVKDIHEGDERTFTVNDITNWLIYTPSFTIQPESVYLLER